MTLTTDSPIEMNPWTAPVTAWNAATPIFLNVEKCADCGFDQRPEYRGILLTQRVPMRCSLT